MDELDFVITAVDRFGNFMWEYPEKIKKKFRELQAMGGEETVQALIENHKTNITILLNLQLGALASGPLAPVLGPRITNCLGELATECLELINAREGESSSS